MFCSGAEGQCLYGCLVEGVFGLIGEKCFVGGLKANVFMDASGRCLWSHRGEVFCRGLKANVYGCLVEGVFGLIGEKCFVVGLKANVFMDA